MGRCLYIIRQVDAGSGALDLCYMKVGRSDWPRSRFPGIQNGCPFALELSAWFKDMGHWEHAVHEAFAKYRVRGEWFLVPNEMVDRLIERFESMADARNLEWKNMSTVTWDEVDLELDKVEASDETGLVAVYVRFAGAPIRHSSGRRGHINLTNFSAHVGMPRHQFKLIVDEYESNSMKETA